MHIGLDLVINSDYGNALRLDMSLLLPCMAAECMHACFDIIINHFPSCILLNQRQDEDHSCHCGDLLFLYCGYIAISGGLH